MIKQSILLIGLVFSAPSFSQCKFIENLSPYQQEVARESYLTGKPYNLGITSVAVAWQESRLGIFKLRLSKREYDRSVGIGHTSIHYNTSGMNAMQRGIWVQEMLTNDHKSIKTMVNDLIYWRDRTKSWRSMLSHYNNGWKGNSVYAKSVAKTVNSISKCNFLGY